MNPKTIINFGVKVEGPEFGNWNDSGKEDKDKLTTCKPIEN
jgi:hypothetical protein